MPFDCNCRGLNLQKEFQDSTEALQRIEIALDETFAELDKPRPEKQALRAALLDNAGEAYELLYTKLFHQEPGCMRICTNTLLYIIEHAGEEIDESQFKELRDVRTPPNDVEKAADERIMKNRF